MVGHETRAVRILFVAHQFFPEHAAGTEVLTLDLARALRDLGHDTAIFAAKRSAPFSRLEQGATEDYSVEGVPVRRVGRPSESTSRPFRLNYENVDMAEAFRRYVEVFRPDVVHFMHLQGVSASVIPVAKKEFCLPAIYTATDFWAICPVVDLRRHDGTLCSGPDVAHCPRCVAGRRSGSKLAGLVKKTPGPLFQVAETFSHTRLSDRSLFLRQVRDLSERPEHLRRRINTLDRVIAPTHLTQNLLIKNGISPSLVEVSGYGVDVSRVRGEAFTEASAKLPLLPIRFGFIGTLGPHKGCDLLVRAFNGLAPGADATLTIYGNDKGFEGFESRLKGLADENPRIYFRGTFPREKIGEVLSEMDVLVVPSRWYENTPLVVYSALAAGIPLVATDLGGLSEIIRHGQNGLLFSMDNVEQLTQHLDTLSRDANLIEKLRSGIGPVKTVDQNAEELERLYNTLVEREKGQS